MGKMTGWKLEFVWKHKSYLDLQIKIMAPLILLYLKLNAE